MPKSMFVFLRVPFILVSNLILAHAQSEDLPWHESAVPILNDGASSNNLFVGSLERDELNWNIINNPVSEDDPFVALVQDSTPISDAVTFAALNELDPGFTAPSDVNTFLDFDQSSQDFTLISATDDIQDFDHFNQDLIPFSDTNILMNSDNSFPSTDSFAHTSLPSCETQTSLTDDFLEARDDRWCPAKGEVEDNFILPIEMFEDPLTYLRENIPPLGQADQSDQGSEQNDNLDIDVYIKSRPIVKGMKEDLAICETNIFGESGFPVCDFPLAGFSSVQRSRKWVTLYYVTPCRWFPFHNSEGTNGLHRRCFCPVFMLQTIKAVVLQEHCVAST